MPNYVDLGARLLALRKMTFPSADKALSYCRSLGVPGLRAKKVAHGRLFYEVGDEIRTVHILIHGISNVIVHSFDGTTFTLYENDGFTMYGLSETFSGRHAPLAQRSAPKQTAACSRSRSRRFSPPCSTTWYWPTSS